MDVRILFNVIMKIRNSAFLNIVLLVLFWAGESNLVIAAPSKNSKQIDSAAMQEYWGAVQAKIREYWHPPEGAKPVASVVRFKILPSGQVANVEIYHSSNNIAIDTSVVEAVSKAAPFPKITIAPYNSRGIYGEMNFSTQKLGNDQLNGMVVQANRALEAGNWQLASIFLTNALKVNPNNEKLKKELSGIYSNQASVLIAANLNSKEAIVLAKRALSLDSSNEVARKILKVH